MTEPTDSPHPTAEPAEPTAWLQAWFHQRSGHITLALSDNFFQAGAIDSFAVIELIEDMEREFAVRFSQDDFQDRRFSSIDGLAAMLAEKRSP